MKAIICNLLRLTAEAVMLIDYEGAEGLADHLEALAGDIEFGTVRLKQSAFIVDSEGGHAD